MWLLNFIPDWTLFLMAVVGVLLFMVGVVVNWFPLLNKYSLPAQVVGFVLAAWGFWFLGGINEKATHDAEIAKFQAELAVMAVNSTAANTVIKTEYVTKLKHIQGVKVSVTEYVDREVIKYDTSCVIPTVVITAVNAAAANQELK